MRITERACQTQNSESHSKGFKFKSGEFKILYFCPVQDFVFLSSYQEILLLLRVTKTANVSKVLCSSFSKGEVSVRVGDEKTSIS